nr:hypothetical protein [Pediococcus pentosaceus]
MFSARLKAIAQPVLADIENHPFVRGIQAGAVPAAALMVYVEQDTFFLDAFAKVYAGALSKCTTKDQMRFFEEQIRYTLNDEAGRIKSCVTSLVKSLATINMPNNDQLPTYIMSIFLTHYELGS